MRKKILVSSAIIALLTLVSTQTVFVNNVRSDPSQHTGIAHVGQHWISELDVSSHLNDIRNIGIGRVNAADDWILWANGKGNISTEWSVEIGSDHPEYWVIFRLSIYNVDDKCNEIGNKTFMKTYVADRSYDENGTLKLSLEFNQSQKQSGSQTLVCYLGAFIRINNTKEIANFTSIADDRCIVAVDFLQPCSIPSFSVYRDEANDQLPSMWSWIDGWENEFANENEMLNTQTYFKVGHDTAPSGSSSQNTNWELGTIDVELTHYHGDATFSVEDQTIDWKCNPGSSWLTGKTHMHYETSHPDPYVFCVFYRYHLNYENYEGTGLAANWIWCTLFPDTGQFGNTISVQDRNSDDIVDIAGDLWVGGFLFLKHWNLADNNYQINIIEGSSVTTGSDAIPYQWEEKCAYQNSSYSIDVANSTNFGITTVDADISTVLDYGASNEFVYTFAGDRGDTRVRVSC